VRKGGGMGAAALKLAKLSALGWELRLYHVPHRFDENIARALVRPAAEVKAACASRHLLLFYLVEVGKYAFAYALADPSLFPGRPAGRLKAVDPAFCPTATVVKRGVEGLASLYEAAIRFEGAPPAALSVTPLLMFPTLCQRPTPALEPLCKRAQAIREIVKRPIALEPLGGKPQDDTTESNYQRDEAGVTQKSGACQNAVGNANPQRGDSAAAESTSNVGGSAAEVATDGAASSVDFVALCGYRIDAKCLAWLCRVVCGCGGV